MKIVSVLKRHHQTLFWSLLALASIGLQAATFGWPGASADSLIFFLLNVAGWFVTGMCIAPLRFFMPKDKKPGARER